MSAMPESENLMITFIYGDNNYQARQLLRDIIAVFEPKEGIERYGASDITPSELTNVITSLNLFTPKRLVVMSGASENKELWDALAEQLASVPDEVHLVLHEQTVDKRTKTFKLLQKTAAVTETKQLNEAEAMKWVAAEAKQRNIALTAQQAMAIIGRAGIDQWQLHFALEKLAGYEAITNDLIEDIIDATPQSSVFALIDAALNRQSAKIQSIVAILRVSEDAYFFFGLLASQIFQLVALASTKKPSTEVAKDLGVHPYPLQKMQAQARKLGKSDTKKIAAIMANCDTQLKRSGVEPWLVIEQALLKLATLKQ